MSLLIQPYPFRRLISDYMIRGQTRIWWEMDPDFNDPGTQTFQLQFGRTGLPNAADWVNVGTPVTNAYFATDDTQRDTGMVITAHYRVALTTSRGRYVSAPINPVGFLPTTDWIAGREILRKEQLRLRKVGSEGTLLKRMRYGTKCSRCRDALTSEVTDSSCPECNGTGFRIGYHAPANLHCFDLSPQVFDEKQDADTRGTIRDGAIVTARVLAFPALQRFDAWINNFSDERWIIHQIKHVAVLRGVPLVSEVRMHLAQFTHRLYRIEIGGEPADREGAVSPGFGCGSVSVDHDYGGADNLVTQDANGCGVSGVTILAFKRADWDAAAPGRPDPELAIAATSTGADGRWLAALKLDPGEYVLLLEKTGAFGPDEYPLTVAAPGSSSSDYWDDTA